MLMPQEAGCRERRVPEEWEVKELDELCKKIAVGLAISVTPYMRSEGVKLIRNQNIKRNYFNDRSVVYIDPKFADANKSKKVKLGDIVAVRTGSNIGEACVVPEEFDGALTFTTLIARPDPKLLDSFFLSTHINSDRGISEVNRLCAGGGKPNLNSGELKRYRLLAPPLPEQQKIAQILSTWDKAITTTEQRIANSQQQKKALMQQLLTGKQRLLDQNGERFSGEWRRLPFSDLVSLVKTKFDPKTNADDVRECIELEHITQVSSSLCGSTNTSDAVSTKTAFENGDVLFGKLRPYLRKYWKADRQGVCSTEIWVFRTRAKVAADYIFQVVQLDSFIEVANKSSGTHMPRADWNVVKDFLIPTPSLEEQQKIAAVLSAADQEITTLQQQLDHLKQEKKALMQQLLTGKRRVQIN
ncbi:MAG: restriction endonuclease subunit S [Oceanospirillaceae bacterium]|nr:restriction endonuclease subunit S [Oceanospirillaceae bacterium]